MNILAVLPKQRAIPAAEASVAALDWPGLDLLTLAGGDAPGTDVDTRWANITAKLIRARAMALAGGYDALLCLDDDQVYPPDLVRRLAACLDRSADVAYGLTVWRNPPHRWSAILDAPADGDDQSRMAILDAVPERRTLWGQVVPVAGCGTFGTLIARAVLEAMPFRRAGMHCADWYFAQDARRLGFRQVVDTGASIGHVNLDLGAVLWPDPDRRVRQEAW